MAPELTKFRNHILGVYTVTQLLRENSFGLGLDLELIPLAQRCSVSLPHQRRNRSIERPNYSDGMGGVSQSAVSGCWDLQKWLQGIFALLPNDSDTHLILSAWEKKLI